MRHAPCLALLPLLALTAGCGSSSTPATPNTAPTPTPAPTPVASPTLPVSSFTCPFPAMPDLHNTCPKLKPNLSDFVENAISRVVREHPELFDLGDSVGEGSYRVRDRDKYHHYVIEAVHDQHVCGVVQKEEIAVKVNNDYNEQYNIWTSSGYIRHGKGAYITTCFPAQF